MESLSEPITVDEFRVRVLGPMASMIGKLSWGNGTFTLNGNKVLVKDGMIVEQSINNTKKF
ncbi:hypothetical protein QJ854_gp805 [Moumouvirus goulette]|uniref:Uncharacterized protein n=1 Tax=Moumouvirus goulette TaxID=1247379 RepID=M1PW65_9VIRU|nr:hypothetical protein QJ854_gp805 [Moumouvirus goulette]AGF84977.1 hypothetical protein glt_00168 [Moumouvirus goulette]